MKAAGRLVVALLFVSACGSAAKKIRDVTDLRVDPTSARVARGEYLVNGPAACGACHNGRENGDPLSPNVTSLLGGGMVLQEGDKIRVYTPNITPDQETGLGAWTDDEILRTIRDGVRRDGTVLFPIMPYNSYGHLSDEDAMAIVAYLRSVPAAKPATAAFPYEAPGMLKMIVSKGGTLHEPATDVAPVSSSDQVKYGEYLAHVGHCGDCHSRTARGPRDMDDPKWMAGSDVPFETAAGVVWAPNLTPDEATGLGKYSAEQIKTALVRGTRLDGEMMMPPMSLFQPHLANMTDADLDALVAYLKSLPATSKQTPPREPSEAGNKYLADAKARLETRLAAPPAAEPGP